jgi:hypothetical protein
MKVPQRWLERLCTFLFGGWHDIKWHIRFLDRGGIICVMYCGRCGKVLSDASTTP